MGSEPLMHVVALEPSAANVAEFDFGSVLEQKRAQLTAVDAEIIEQSTRLEASRGRQRRLVKEIGILERTIRDFANLDAPATVVREAPERPQAKSPRPSQKPEERKRRVAQGQRIIDRAIAVLDEHRVPLSDIEIAKALTAKPQSVAATLSTEARKPGAKIRRCAPGTWELITKRTVGSLPPKSGLTQETPLPRQSGVPTPIAPEDPPWPTNKDHRAVMKTFRRGPQTVTQIADQTGFTKDESRALLDDLFGTKHVRKLDAGLWTSLVKVPEF